MIPKARSQGVLVHRIGDELVVYDRDREVAHRLDHTATRVWHALDRNRSTRELVALLGLDEGDIELAVDLLQDADLLEGASPPDVSRRDALRRVTAAAAVGAMVISIPAPLSADGKSPGGGGCSPGSVGAAPPGGGVGCLVIPGGGEGPG